MEEGKSVPKRVVNDSAASRNSVVEMALSFSLSMGTSVKDFLKVSRKVPPGGYAVVAAMTFARSIVGRDVLRRLLAFRDIGSFQCGAKGRGLPKRQERSAKAARGVCFSRVCNFLFFQPAFSQIIIVHLHVCSKDPVTLSRY